MYFYATVQPFMKSAGRPRDRTTYLNPEERVELTISMDQREHVTIPCCIDHAHGEKSKKLGNFVVPPKLVIGRAVDAFIRGNGDQIFMGEIFWDRDEAMDLVKGINEREERWGVSLCTDLEIYPDLGLVKSKKITHLGITRDPEFGPENSYIHAAFTSYQSLEREVYEKFVINDPHAHIPSRLKKRLHDRYGAIARQAAASQFKARVVASPVFLPLPRLLAQKPTPAAVAISAAASRHVQSDSGNLLQCTVPPMPSAFLASSLKPATTKMAENNQQAAAAAAAPNLAELERMTGEIDTLMNSFSGKRDEEIYTSANLARVSELNKNYKNFLRDNGMNAFDKAPPGTTIRYAQLDQYLNNAAALMDAYVDKAGVQAESNAMKNALRESMLNGTSQQPLPIATQVMAFANYALTNHRALEDQLLLKQGEVELLQKDLKRLREEKATPSPSEQPAAKKAKIEDPEAQLPDAAAAPSPKTILAQGAASHSMPTGPSMGTLWLGGMRGVMIPDNNFLKGAKNFSNLFDLPGDNKLRKEAEKLIQDCKF